MPLSPGDKLGRYEILAPIGSGGMGKVYRAHDPRLNRDVAIKVSNTQFTERFTHEARAIAALNHANICHVYDVGPDYLVMEYVEGQDLRGPLSFDEALPIIRQLIDGIEAAHEKNIIHRDLKPANIKITPEGVVKILDFGLAKAMGPPPSQDVDPENSPTLTITATQAGAILGTAAYMAPEQARGKAADKRSDIWSFGVILHELLTGKRLFQGESAAEILGSVLNKEPDISATPPRARKLLRWCLEKDCKARLQAIGDARTMLEEEPESVRPRPRFGTGSAASLAAGVVLLVGLGALLYVHFREKPAAGEMVRFEISVPTDTTFGDPAVSPDGRKIAFVAAGADHKPMVWVRSLDSEEARPLAGTEGATDRPIWSPNGRLLAFRSGGKLKKIDAAGGPAQILCDASADGGAAWTTDNRILFGTTGPVQLVSAGGGTPTPLTALDLSRAEFAHGTPALLPDGHHFLYRRGAAPLENGGVYIGSLDAKPDSKPDRQGSKKLLPDAQGAMYAPSPVAGSEPGFLLFVRGMTVSDHRGTLMAQPFNARRMDFAGDAVPIAEQVDSFSVSPAGVLVFRTAGTPSNSQLTWYDRKGNVLSTAGDAGEYRGLALSPDGTRVAYERGVDLWLFEFARGGVYTKFTFGNPAAQPAWSADGSRIVFVSTRGIWFDIYQKASNLAEAEELLYQSPEVKVVPSWSHDGRFLMYSVWGSNLKTASLWILPTGGSAAGRKPLPFLRTESLELEARFSPDGRWVAYRSDQSGKDEIYVLPFDPLNQGSPAGGLHQISQDGGDDPHWSQNGKELIYLAADGYLMSAAVSATGSAFQAGAAQRLFKSPVAGFGAWDVSRDGKRFLIAAPVSSGAAPSQPYHVVLNWTELLKR